MNRTLRNVALFLSLVIPAMALAAPKPDLWPRWEAHDPDSQRVVDHSTWDRFLDRYHVVGEDGIARIDYAAVDAESMERLQGYIDRLTDLPISEYKRDQQQAYWINLYNALTVDVILDHYPVDSITEIDISPGLFSNGPWGKKLVKIEGAEVSLDDIEHRILRPIWKDPRIHYAVNCAALGCPNLQGEAYTAANMERLLSRGARQFVNHQRGVRFDDGELVVSSIYHWFQEDFGGTERGVIEHLRMYAEPELDQRLMGVDMYDDHRYDWSANDA